MAYVSLNWFAKIEWESVIQYTNNVSVLNCFFDIIFKNRCLFLAWFSSRKVISWSSNIYCHGREDGDFGWRLSCCIYSVIFSVLVSGRLHGFFNSSGGLRQLDPLSVYHLNYSL